MGVSISSSMSKLCCDHRYGGFGANWARALHTKESTHIPFSRLGATRTGEADGCYAYIFTCMYIYIYIYIYTYTHIYLFI